MKQTSILPILRNLLLSALLLCGTVRTEAQVTGTKTIGVDYPTLAAAITALNTTGISGAVVINVPGGYTETAPAGGYQLGSTVLNASTGVASTLTIVKSGTGVDPVLTAPVGTSTSTDGIFIIKGTDYVIINGIDLKESAGNITATTQMEWGYALVKLQATAPFDGSNNVTIKNCTITLNINNTASVGIYANNHIATSTTSLTITTVADAMSNCKFYTNTVQNCNTGISLNGFSGGTGTTLYNQGNDIGGTGTATGNIIRNFAGSTDGSGIQLSYEHNPNVAYNNINNIAGGGIASIGNTYGVNVQNGTDVSVNIANNIINLTADAGSSNSIYGAYISCTGVGTVKVDTNTFTASGGSGGDDNMIYFNNGNLNSITNGNNFADIHVNANSLYLINHSSTLSTENFTCIGNYTSGTAAPYITNTIGSTFAAYYSYASTDAGIATITDNNFSNISLDGSATFFGIRESNGGSGMMKTLQNNSISEVTLTGSGTVYAIQAGYAATLNISNNTVFDIDGGSGDVYGVYLNNGITDTISNNSVHNMISNGGNVYGVYISDGTTISVYQDTVYTLSTSAYTGLGYGIYSNGGSATTIHHNRVYDIEGSGNNSSVNGMYLNSGGSNLVYNNLVADIRTPTFSGTGNTQLVGIYLSNGTTFEVDYNTIYMNASSTGTDFGSCAIFASTGQPVTLRNNIFDNSSTPLGGGQTVAYMRGGSALGTYQAASDNNAFYAGTPGASNVIYYDGGATTAITMSDYKALVTPRDGNSVTENITFLSTSGASGSFLHPDPSVPTQIEGGAVNISGITDDAYGTIRAGNPGYTGTGTAPDMGAVEDNYIYVDLSAPNIIYTPLVSACATTDRSFTVTLTDATGVPTTGALMPRVYFRKGTAPWQSAAGTLTSGTALNGNWEFIISSSAMGGLALGDVVSYFVIAQDIVTPINIGSNPGAGLVATDVNTITTFPTAPNAYSVLPTMTGTYTVGAGGAYTTITDAVAAYNTSCVAGAVVFQLTDATYDVAETFPITINANPVASPVNTLTIKPAPGVSPVITGSSDEIFLLNGADYVIIDGSNGSVANSVCPRVAASRDMILNNTNFSTSSAVVWLQNASSTDGATNNIIRNCTIVGADPTETLVGIGIAGNTVDYSSQGSNNNNNRIENDSIMAVQTGIFTFGDGATTKNTGNVISQNLINDNSGATSVGNNGIIVQYEDNITISANTVANIINNFSTDIIAISVGFPDDASGTSATSANDVTNATIIDNKIDNIAQTSTFTAIGISVAGVPSGTNTIANNMISGVISNGTGPDFASGIFIGGVAGGATNIFYNTVDITGTASGGNTPIYAISVSGYDDPILNIKNNIFLNNGDPGDPSLVYSIGLNYGSYTNMSSDHNDFFSVGNNLASVNGLSGGTNEPGLADWQAATGQDANSKNVQPVFAAASDLHLTTSGVNLPMMNTGIPVPIVTDYDCAPRDPATPDMGINEFTVPNCASIVTGTLTPVTPVSCGTNHTSITAVGTTAAVGITYQWQSSTDSVTFTTIAGATSFTYSITPAITTTTYYRYIIACSFSGLKDSTGVKITVNPLPVISVTPNGGAYCSGTASNVTMTASGALTYTWGPAVALSATTGATVTASPSSTRVYTITGTDALGCVGTHTSTIVVTPTPPTITISPATASLCAGGFIPLVASAPMPSSIFSEDFNAGLSAWVIDNTGSTNIAAIPLTQWDVQPDGYYFGFETFHSPDLSSFAMTNAEQAYGDVTQSSMTSPSFSLANYTSAALTFQHYYDYSYDDNYAQIQLSTDGGSTWTTLYDYSTDYTTVGTSTSFANANFDLTPYVGSANCMIRFNYKTEFYGNYWAVDNVAVTGTGTYTNLVWSPTTGLYADAGLTTPYTGAATTTVYATHLTTTTTPIVTNYIATGTNGTCVSTGTATVTSQPAPNAGTITGATVVCPGATITLSSGIAGGTWTSGSTGIATVTAGTGVVHGVAAGTATISYAVTNTCGTATVTTSITVNPAPNAGTITGPATVCGGGATITLSDAVTGGTWTSSNTAAATITAAGLVTGVAAGTTTISYAATNSCGTATVTKIITVNPVPNAGTISGATDVCAGSAIQLSDNVTGGIWSSGSAVATVTATGLVTGVSSGTATISYTYTNSCGSAYVVYSVLVNPVPLTYAVLGGGAYCAGAAGVDVSLSGSDLNVNYQLYLGTGSTGTPVAGTGGPISFGFQTAAGTYTVFATSTAGCTHNMSGSATVTINPTTPPTISISAPAGDTICTGSASTFTAITTNAGPTPTYQWTVNGLIVSAASILSYTPTNGDIISVLITSSTCAVPDTASSTIIITVINYATPTISIATGTGTNTSCSGLPVTYTATTTYGGYTPLIRWTVNGINVATGPSYTYQPLNGDVVYAALISDFPCRLMDSVFSNQINMLVGELYYPSLTIVAHPGILVAGQTDTLIATTTNAGPAPTYQWAVNGVIVPTATTAFFVSNTLMSGDSVSCTVTTTGVCGGIQAFKYVIVTVHPVGIAQTSQGLSNYSLVPNPNKGTFVVKGSTGSPDDATVTLEVTDILGQKVYVETVIAKSGQLSEQISLRNTLANGMYLLNIINGTEKQVFHFVLEQ